MASTLQTTYTEKKNQSEQDRKKLRKLKETEKSKISFGWRYIQVTKTMKVLIPCDREGNPTKEGLEKINAYKQL